MSVQTPTGKSPAVASKVAGLDRSGVTDDLLAKVPESLRPAFLEFVTTGRLNEDLSAELERPDSPCRDAVDVALREQAKQFEEFAQAIAQSEMPASQTERLSAPNDVGWTKRLLGLFAKRDAVGR